MMSPVHPPTLHKIVTNLVDAARQGDQNALATLTEVGRAAKAGNPRAMAANRAAFSYIREHPAPRQSDIGAEGASCLATLAKHGPVRGVIALLFLPRSGDAATNAGAVRLANGPAITPDLAMTIASKIQDETAQKAFLIGATAPPEQLEATMHGAPPAMQDIANAGAMLNKAQKIQAVRRPGSSITAFCPDIGVELGCPDARNVRKGACGCKP